MPTLVLETTIAAPRERCFDLARDIDFHCRSATKSRERAVAGITLGLIELGQSVTFEATHFGVRQRLTSKITEFERPHFFVDEMQRGAFASFHHRHEFTQCEDETLMRDTVVWKSPLGILGRVADALFLKRHLANFLRERNALLKRAAESSAAI